MNCLLHLALLKDCLDIVLFLCAGIRHTDAHAQAIIITTVIRNSSEPFRLRLGYVIQQMITMTGIVEIIGQS